MVITMNNRPVIQWMCGISLKLRRRGICLLATPFTVTIWEFFCPAQRVKPSVGRQAAGRLEQVCFQHSLLPPKNSYYLTAGLSPGFQWAGKNPDRVGFFCLQYQFTFEREGRELNNKFLCTAFTGSLMLSAGKGSVQKTFEQRPSSLIIWK